MILASIQRIREVVKHSNADALDIVTVLNYKAIVKRDQYKVGDLIVFIEPDSVLPQVPWSVMYRSKSNRVKAVRLRGEWSFGIVESFANVGYNGPIEEGLDITGAIGVTKYEPPMPADLSAAGVYGYGIPRTDETRWQSVRDLPWGEKVDVTLKVDGQSWSAFIKLNQDGTVEKGLGGRSFLYQLDTINNYTRNEQKYDVLNKLEKFCRERNVSLCLRGESYGQGIQKFGHNPHAKLPVDLVLYSTWLIDERRYARKGDPYYIFDIAPILGLPTVPVLEKDVVLTSELIKKYDEELEFVNGQPFEGVVINTASDSFKVINKNYDSKK